MSGRRTLTIALVLLTIATLFRLWATQHARFTGDESDYWVKSRQLAVGAYRPVYGPEITGSEANLPGPAYYYLMAAPQALGASPYFGSVFVVLGHALAAWLLFLLARAARGDRAGLVALVLVMFAPWDVLYADRIWGSCVVPIWGALAIYAAVRSRTSGRWQAALLFLCLVLPQLHLSVPVLWLACLAILVLRPPEKIVWKWVLIGVGAAVLAYLDPMIAEFRSDFTNTRNILTKGTGAESWDVAVKVPFQVFGYAVGYASSEIGYHFARGYWGGRFDDFAQYFTLTGWQKWFGLHGVLFGSLGLVSIGLAIVSWADNLWNTARATGRAVLKRNRSELDLAEVLTIAMLVGLAGGALLMMLARKRYFPHYANILMPMALWPAVIAVDGWLARWKDYRRWIVGVVLAASVSSMMFSAVRYYRTIDTLNGLGNTIDMVGRVLEDRAPVRVDFTHFQNIYAWQVIADVLYKKRLPLHPKAPIRYRVHNDRRFEGDVPPGGEVFRGLLMVRTPPTGADKSRATGSAARRNWGAFEVRVTAPAERRRACVRETEGCRYGDEPWQTFKPDFLEIAEQMTPVLFLHPITSATVSATYPIPANTTRGRVKVALSDGATESNNRAPVVVTVRRGTVPIGTLRADNQRGFRELLFTLTATGAAAITLDVTTENDGARIFGFDLDFD